MGAQMVGMTAALDRIDRQIHGAIRAANVQMIRFAEAVCGEAARRAPVETGDLRGSFVVIVNGEQWAHTVSDGGGITLVHDRTDVPEGSLEIYIGTAGCVYALRQHEELTWQHPRGGQAKFLESAFDDLVTTLLQQLKEAVREGAQGNG